MSTSATAVHEPNHTRLVLSWMIRLLTICAIAVLAWGFRSASERVANPASSLPDHADAVVVFFGGEDRAPAAAELMATGVADTLVINHGLKDGRLAEAFSPLCSDPTLDYEVVCIVAEPSNTIGEARSFSALATDRGWTALIAFTSDFHLARAHLHLERCFDGSVDTQAVDSANETNDNREASKLLLAWTLRRGC